MTVSIIIPVYNARGYLSRTAGDLLHQSFRGIEVIFVDDGSTDGTGQILDRIAAKDKRVRVLHKENGGTARARNAGMKAASGEYLMFMDDDDRITRSHVQEYASAIKETGADIVIGGYQRVTPDGKVLFTRRLMRGRRQVRSERWGSPSGREGIHDDSAVSPGRISIHDDSAISTGCIGCGKGGTHGPSWLAYISSSPWAKIYRRSFVEACGAHFLEYPYGEDVYFHMGLLAANPRIAYSSSVSYGWVDRKESISNTIHRGMHEEANVFPLLNQVLKVHPQRGEFFRYFMYRHCAYHIYTAGRDAEPEKLKQEIKLCHEWLKRNHLLSVLSPLSPKLEGEILRDRIAVLVIRWMFRLHMESLFAWIYCNGQ